MISRLGKRSFFLTVFSTAFLITSLILFGYFLERPKFHLFYALLLGSFGAYYFISRQKLDFKLLFGLGLIFRLILLFATPELSDDFYRFIWDGALMVEGENPFLYLPTEVLGKQLIEGQFLELFPLLNSPNYYTVYPTIIQLINVVSVFVGQSVFGSMLVMKLIFLGSELASFYFLRKLLVYYQKDENRVFWYWLCPLIVLEFVGNLHHEAIMLTFVLGAIYYLKQSKTGLSAIFLGLAIFTKLTPLLFVPFFVFSLSQKESFKYTLILVMSLVIMFLPMGYQEGYLFLFKSIQLYFGSFEFNSSLYYLSTYVEWVLIDFKWIYKGIVMLSMGVFLLFWFQKKKDVSRGIAFIYLVYVLSAQSVHPWYILPLFPLFILNAVPKYYWVWMILIPLTYMTYMFVPYQQQIWVNVVEYAVVFGLMFMDVMYSKFRRLGME